MSFFDQFGHDVDNIQQEFLGPDYNYARNILSPTEINMKQFDGKNFSIFGNNGLDELAADFAGLIDYVELLVSGTSGASKSEGRPLGNRFFLPTAAKCKGPDGKHYTRNIYINNIPTGSIPIISNIAGKNFTEFRGLIPGTFTDLEVLNPLSLFSGMFTTSDSSCTNVELSTIDGSNSETYVKKYVLNQDIAKITPCVFKDQVNVITKQTCRGSEAFTNINPSKVNNNNFLPEIDDDILIKLYFFVLAMLYFYIFIKIFLKK